MNLQRQQESWVGEVIQVGTGGGDCKGTGGYFWFDTRTLAHTYHMYTHTHIYQNSLWWWCHRCVYPCKCIKLYTLNICSLLYEYCTSIKQKKGYYYDISLLPLEQNLIYSLQSFLGMADLLSVTPGGYQKAVMNIGGVAGRSPDTQPFSSFSEENASPGYSWACVELSGLREY